MTVSDSLARGFVPGPCRWEAGPGAAALAAPRLAALGRRALWVGERRLLAPWLDRWEGPFAAAGFAPATHAWPEQGECHPGAVEALAAAARAEGADALVGCGGGKCLDACKLAADALGLPLALIPTSPATCACATQVAVRYHEGGEFMDVVDLDRPASLVVADAALLASAGPRHFAAGLADTLAKILEARAAAAPEGFGAAAGMALAGQSWAVASEGGFGWLARGEVEGPEAARCLEGLLLLSGLASCVGGVPAAAAHSLCDGLSILPGMKGWLHGELVGLGLLYQDLLLAELGRPALGAAAGLAPLRQAGLPAALPAWVGRAEALAVVDKMLQPGESIHGMPDASAIGRERLAEILLTLRAS